MATFDLGNLFKQAFGYNPPEKAAVPQAPARQTTSAIYGGSYYATDAFGVEYFLPVTLNDYLIPLAVMSVNTRKTIVSTPMPQRGGSVKEMITVDDYVFNLKGILITDNNTYPEQGIVDIHKIFLVNDILQMRSVLSDIFLNGKYDHGVIIRDVKWPMVTGIEHAKPFEMELEADMIYDLYVNTLS